MFALRSAFTPALVAVVAACSGDPGAIDSSGTLPTPTRAPNEVSEIAGAPVTGHPDPLSLLESDDAQLAVNKRLVFDMWRSIVNAGHVELADQMLTPGYIQHSPLLPTGREAFKTIFSQVPRRVEIPPLVEPPVIALVAEDDLVVMTFIETLQTPDGTGTYTSTHFNLFRIEDGRLAEHWHSLQGPPGPAVLPADQGGPQRVTGATTHDQLRLLEAENTSLADNKRLVFDLWRNVMDAGIADAAERYVAADYVEHNPNAGSGLAAFRAYHTAANKRPLQDWIEHPLVAMVAEGDLVVQVLMYEHPHPIRAGETYTSTWFDMFRVAGGRVIEHWDPAVLPGSPIPFGGEP